MSTLNKNHTLLGFLFIGLGAYFFLRHLNIPHLQPFYSWPFLLVLIGAAFLFHSYVSRDTSSLFTGTIVTGFGIHFLAVDQLAFWRDHWGVYLCIVGAAFLLQYRKTKKGLVPALVLLGTGAFVLFSPTLPAWIQWINQFFLLIERFWPLVLIAFGLYLLKKKT
ncbi:LiaI-LiaF-like domain-containing protein [Halobacillus litoralis]|uniref:LiaI-LiaF-like domain-containing protein n=1 Tax=Halobacillus litoralis TaxID=45668 RepID=UPI00359C9C14